MTIEAVNDYTSCNGPSLSNSIADAAGFKATMLASIWNHANYTSGLEYSDNWVWTSDFYDPDRTGLADYDSSNFDRGVDAFSYFAGHGFCDTGDTGQYCTAAANCTSPPTGAGYPAFCRRAPGDYFGQCAYTRMARSLALGNCTAGPSGRGGRVNYSSGLVRWGESSTTGSWAGAGSNGGTNAVINHSSCAEMSNRGHEIWPAFAGIHIFANVLVHTGDTGNISDRGTNFALEYAVNASSSVANSWLNGMSGNDNRNSYCTNWWGNQVYGGGFGVNGCGGHVVTALGATAAEVTSHLNETWYQMKEDSRDGTGGAYWGSIYTCNYDCWAWPFGI